MSTVVLQMLHTARVGTRRGAARAVALAAWCAAGALAASGCGSSTSSDGLSVSPSSLAFEAIQGDVAPAPQRVSATVTNMSAVYFGAGVVDSAPGWLRVDLVESQMDPGAQVTITSTALSPGTYTATLRLAIGDAMKNVLATRDVSIRYTVRAGLTASPTSLALTAVEGGPVTAANAIALAGSTIAWTASASESWLALDRTSGTGPGKLHATADPRALAPGDYAGTITVQPDGAPPVAVAVALHVDAAALAVEPQVAFSGKNGAALPAQALHLALTNGAAQSWTAAASASWIVLDDASGSTPATVKVSVDPARGPLASGSYKGTITFSASVDGRALTATVDVALSLAKPVLTLLPASLALGGATGRDLQPQAVKLSLDTVGPEIFAWTASTAQRWIASSAASGTVSGAPTSITVAPSISGLTGGTYTGSLAFTATVNGDQVTASLPVQLGVDDHRLLASDSGVAFAKTPSQSALTRALQVLDNFGAASTWTASSSQPWLSVTSSGVAGGKLVLTADPAGLATDTVHYATVTVVPGDATIAGNETVQVGLWVGSSDPAGAASISGSFVGIAVDPIRPYAYVHTGSTSVTVYNVFNATAVSTIASVGARLGAMTVSPDGAKLFVLDKANYRIVPVDLASGTAGTPFPLGAPSTPDLHHARTNGKGLLLAGNGCIYDPSSGKVLYPAAGCTGTASAVVSASLLGNIFSIDAIAHRLDYLALGGGTVFVGPALLPNITAWNTADYAFSPDGSRMYCAVGSPYDFYVVDTTAQGTALPLVQTLPGSAYPDNIEVAKDGRIFAGIDGYADQQGHDAWVFSSEGVVLKSYNVDYYGLLKGGLRVSGDGLRMVTIARGLGEGTALKFLTTLP